MTQHWYKIEKFYQGGSLHFQVATAKVLTARQKKELAEEFGDATTGGKTHGYRMYVRKLMCKSSTLPIYSPQQVSVNVWKEEEEHHETDTAGQETVPSRNTRR